MRLLHTSDWHLGHSLHGQGREHEHAQFLQWLLEALGREGADALIVSGDVFDTSNPSAQAQAVWYRFLAQARRRYPHLSIAVIGGNHDSASRLEAPRALLEEGFEIQVVGGLPRRPDGSLDADRLLVPLRRRGGEVAAWLAAVPFLRAADLPAADRAAADQGDGDELVDGVRRVYAEILEAARRRREGGQALVATGHCYVAGTALSELSERKVLGGNQHALPADLFCADVAYVALGHLHLAQSVSGADHLRYSGSPLPLALSEARYPHQVVLVELDGEHLAGWQPLRVPRAVELLRVPDAGAAPLPDVLAALARLERAGAVPEREWPYLEVAVAISRPEPDLRRQLEDALDGKAARLLRFSVERSGGRAGGPAEADLRDLKPEEVFLSRYRRDHEAAPPPELLAAFHELVEEAAHRLTD